MSDATPLPARDQHHLNAAEGWLELGDPQSAREELERITPKAHVHRDVLRLLYRLYSATRHWEDALSAAESLLAADSSDVDHWVNRSFVLHLLKRTAEAEALLLPALDRFPDKPIVSYNLACYACVLGRLKEAEALLDRAMTLSKDDADQLRLLALDDPDLAGLWQSEQPKG